MLNQEMRTVTMSRSDMFRVRQALTCDTRSRVEIADPETTEDRRQIAKSSRWPCGERIRSEFTAQLDAQDPEEFRRK